LYRYSSVYNTYFIEEIKKTISTKQDEVKGAITTVEKQLIVLESKVEEINLSNDNKVAILVEGKIKAL